MMRDQGTGRASQLSHPRDDQFPARTAGLVSPFGPGMHPPHAGCTVIMDRRHRPEPRPAGFPHDPEGFQIAGGAGPFAIMEGPPPAHSRAVHVMISPGVAAGLVRRFGSVVAPRGAGSSVIMRGPAS
jgi:hypothetical protein